MSVDMLGDLRESAIDDINISAYQKKLMLWAVETILRLREKLDGAYDAGFDDGFELGRAKRDNAGT